MIVLALFGLLLATSQASHENAVKQCVNGVFNDQELLKLIKREPYQLAIDYATDNLFFSYTAIDDNDALKSAYINLNNKKFSIIMNVEGGFANTVDYDTHTIYLGGSDGIYTYDINTETATNLNVTEDSIWQLYYSNGGVYYTTYPEKKLYKYQNGDVQIVSQLADTKVTVAAIESNENIYFSNKTGLYYYEKVSDNVKYIGTYKANGFTKDLNGKLYFSDYDGIYEINQDNKTVKTLAKIPDVYGMAIEKDGNLIFSNKSSIVRLLPSKGECQNNTN